MIVEGILLFLLALLIYESTSIPVGLPPGSFGWPIIGSLPPRNVHITEHLRNLKKKYGNIYTTKWGSRVIVVLADMTWIKTAMTHPSIQGRADLHSFQLFTFFKNMGAISSSGKVWSDNRRFLLRHLRDLGMGKTKLENSIQEEAEMLVDYLEETAKNKPTEIDWSINVAVLNVIWQLLAGKRYAADDEEIIHYNKMVSDDFEIMQGLISLVDFMPWLLKILPGFILNGIMKNDIMEKHRDEIYEVFKKNVEEHKASLDPENPRDVIDYYLLEIETSKDDPESNFKPDYMNLVITMGDLFAAGSETTSSTLRWMILYMALRPDIQSKVHSAIDAVVPNDRLPSLDDRQQLPYVDAMLLDVMRLSSLSIVGLPHCATETVTLEGYIIPKDAVVLPCLELCHRDAAFWKYPDDLYPEHFLDDQGNLASKKDAFMPFGVGRRQCLGESLARMELFLFASAILQRFTIEAPPGVKLSAESNPEQKLLNVPKPFKVVLKKRI